MMREKKRNIYTKHTQAHKSMMVIMINWFVNQVKSMHKHKKWEIFWSPPQFDNDNDDDWIMNEVDDGSDDEYNTETIIIHT